MSASATRVDLEIVIPVHNERVALEGGVRRLHGFLTRSFPFSWRILIADGASTDGTLKVARRLTYQLDNVEAIRVPAEAPSRAIELLVAKPEARVRFYMDLEHANSDHRRLPALVAPLVEGPQAAPLTLLSPIDRMLDR